MPVPRNPIGVPFSLRRLVALCCVCAASMALSCASAESPAPNPSGAGGHDAADVRPVSDTGPTDAAPSPDVPASSPDVPGPSPDVLADAAMVADAPNAPDVLIDAAGPDASVADTLVPGLDLVPEVVVDECASSGGPSPTPVSMSACSTEGAFGYVRDGNIPFVCARGPANAAKPACLLWRRGSWYLQTRGKVWNSDQVDLGRTCAKAGDRNPFPGGSFICTLEPKSQVLRWALLVDETLLPFVRWDPTETFLSLPCKPPADTSNGSQFYRTTLDIDANDANTLYLNIEWVGPFRSRDGGATWAPFAITGRSLPARKPSGAACHGEYPGFAFVPGNAAQVFFLAGGAPGSEVTTPLLQGGGLWESSDGGAHFRWLGLPEMNQYVSSFARVGNGQTLLWGSTSSLGTATGPKPPTPHTKGLLYRSDDAGNTWRELPTGLWPESGASFLWVDPQNPQHYVVGLFQYLQRLSGSDARAPGMIESLDGGTTWAKLAGVPMGENGVTAENTVISPNGKRIFSCGLGPNRGAACARSEDSGATFATAEALSAVALDPHDVSGQRLMGYRLAGGTPTIPIPAAVLASADGGKTWSVVSALPTDHPGALKWDPIVMKRLYLTADAGAVYRSNDDGAHWSRLTTYTDFIDVPRAD